MTNAIFGYLQFSDLAEPCSCNPSPERAYLSESIKFQMGKDVIVAELVALIVLQRERQLNQLN